MAHLYNDRCIARFVQHQKFTITKVCIFVGLEIEGCLRFVAPMISANIGTILPFCGQTMLIGLMERQSSFSFLDRWGWWYIDKFSNICSRNSMLVCKSTNRPSLAPSIFLATLCWANDCDRCIHWNNPFLWSPNLILPYFHLERLNNPQWLYFIKYSNIVVGFQIQKPLYYLIYMQYSLMVTYLW